jgi:hypothetical protein
MTTDDDVPSGLPPPDPAADAEAERAWHQRACPAPARFLVVAQGEEWTAAELEHLAGCPRCQAFERSLTPVVLAALAAAAAERDAGESAPPPPEVSSDRA